MDEERLHLRRASQGRRFSKEKGVEGLFEAPCTAGTTLYGLGLGVWGGSGALNGEYGGIPLESHETLTCKHTDGELEKDVWEFPLKTLLAKGRMIGVAALAFAASAMVLQACGHSSIARSDAAQTLIATPEGAPYVLPVVTGGRAGWCITDRPGDGCSVLKVAEGPVLAEAWQAQSLPPRRAEVRGLLLTTEAVSNAVIRLGADRTAALPTRPAVGSGPWRGLVVKVSGVPTRPSPVAPLFPGLHKRPRVPAALPSFLPAVGDEGVRMGQTMPAMIAEPGRSWVAPGKPPHGICAVSSSGAAPTVSGFAVTRLRRFAAPFGDAMLACVSVWFEYGGQRLLATALLDAASPGSPPGALPDMRPADSSSGTYVSVGSLGPLVARRNGAAWLVVSGGDSQKVRTELLQLLKLRINLASARLSESRDRGRR